MNKKDLDELIESVIQYFEDSGCPDCRGCQDCTDDSECIYKLAGRLKTQRVMTDETTDKKTD